MAKRRRLLARRPRCPRTAFDARAVLSCTRHPMDLSVFPGPPVTALSKDTPVVIGRRARAATATTCRCSPTLSCWADRAPREGPRRRPRALRAPAVARQLGPRFSGTVSPAARYPRCVERPRQFSPPRDVFRIVISSMARRERRSRANRRLFEGAPAPPRAQRPAAARPPIGRSAPSLWKTDPSLRQRDGACDAMGDLGDPAHRAAARRRLPRSADVRSDSQFAPACAAGSRATERARPHRLATVCFSGKGEHLLAGVRGGPRHMAPSAWQTGTEGRRGEPAMTSARHRVRPRGSGSSAACCCSPRRSTTWIGRRSNASVRISREFGLSAGAIRQRRGGVLAIYVCGGLRWCSGFSRIGCRCAGCMRGLSRCGRWRASSRGS